MKKKTTNNTIKLASNLSNNQVIGHFFESFSNLLPVKKIKNTKTVIAFWHPKPSYKNHILIVPKKRITSLLDLKIEDMLYVQDIIAIAQEIVNEQGWSKSGYKLIMNGGNYQKIKQLHFHLISGEELR